MEQMWSRTGVLPSALLEVARFDSSLDLTRLPSSSAPLQQAPLLRMASYPYGLAMRPMWREAARTAQQERSKATAGAGSHPVHRNSHV